MCRVWFSSRLKKQWYTGRILVKEALGYIRNEKISELGNRLVGLDEFYGDSIIFFLHFLRLLCGLNFGYLTDKCGAKIATQDCPKESGFNWDYELITDSGTNASLVCGRRLLTKPAPLQPKVKGG